MFSANESKLRHVSARSNANTRPSVRGTEKEEAAERIRKERDGRKLLREQCKSAERIQTWWRSRRGAYSFFNSTRTSFDKKLSDIEKVLKLFESNGLPYAPPASIVIDLFKMLQFRFQHNSKDFMRAVSFVEMAIYPTLSQLEREKNIASILSQNWARSILKKLMQIIFHLMNSQSCKVLGVKLKPAQEVAIFGSLRCLIGSGNPFKLKYTEALCQDFKSIRESIGYQNILMNIRLVLMSICQRHLDINLDESGESLLELSHQIRPPVDSNVDNLLDMCMFLVDTTMSTSINSNSSTKQAINTQTTSVISDFCSLILSVPVVTCNLSSTGMKKITRWDKFPDVLSAIEMMTCGAAGPGLSDTRNALPKSSSNSVISSEHWIFGNLTSFAPFLDITHASQESIISDLVLDRYLTLYLSLLHRYNLPGVLQGRNSVLMTRQGSTFSASGIPKALQYQALSILDGDFNKRMYSRVFLPLKDHEIISKNTSDLKEIEDALKSNGFNIISTTLQEQQASSKMFSSKWAQKILSNVAQTIGINSSSMSSSSGKMDYSEVQPPAGTTAAGGTGEADIDTSEFEVNRNLVARICRLWSIVFPLASQARFQSIPWKELSRLVFTTRLAEKLWTAVLYLCGSRPLEHFAVNFQPSDIIYRDSRKASSSDAIGKDVYSALAALVAVLKVSLITTNDADLYETGKPLPIHQLLPFVRSLKQILYREIRNDPSIIFEPSKKQGAIHDSKKLSTIPLPSSSSSSSSRVSSTREVAPDPRPSANANANSSFFERALSAFGFSSASTTSQPININTRPLDNSNGNTAASISLTTSNIPPAQIQREEKDSNGDEFQSLVNYCVVSCMSSVLTDLHTRWARRPFSQSSLWEISSTESASVHEELRMQTAFAVSLLRVMAWAVPFHDRMKLFREFVDREKLSIQGSNDHGMGLDVFQQAQSRPRSAGTVVRIRRSRVVEDGMAAVEKTGEKIKDRLVVRYVNDFGEEEMGIDVGGLFKDFLSDLSQRVFDPNYGLFLPTEKNLIFPNPAASAIYEEGDLEALFLFLGKVLGKALFENITIQPQFAHFFLAFMHGKYDFMHLIDDLKTFDEELFKNVMFLNTYEGDIADLSLSFAISDESFGNNKEIELFPGGSKLAVTSANRHRYIHGVAKYYLHDRINIQARSFFRGLYQVIQPDLLSIFCAPELQVLISGSLAQVSVEELQRHTLYAGGYSSMDRNITRFWAVVSELTERDVALLLKFVTSCERPPSLGFAALEPPFTIQRVSCSDNSRLPSASTCFNILKLPTYSSQSILKEKLLTSIRSGAGFDLS